VGSDGNLWFTEFTKNKIGMINPTTHAIAEFPIPTASGQPVGITTGPDHDLWFTENTRNQIGQINPTTHVITEFPVPIVQSGPRGITAGPDGNLWFTQDSSDSIGQAVLSAPATAPDLALTGGAPASVTVGQAVSYTLTLTNDGTGEATGVTLTDSLPSGVTFVSATGGVMPVNGVLTFALGSLAAGASRTVTVVITPTAAGSLSNSATVRMDQADPTPADNAVTVDTAVATPDVAGPSVISVRRFGFHHRPTSLVLTFDKPLDPARAQDLANYQLVALDGSRRAIRIRSAAYDPASRTVTLRPAHRLYLYHRFRLTVVGTGPGGVSSSSGALMDGQGAGRPGSDLVTTLSMANLMLTPAEQRDAHLMRDIKSQSVKYPGLAHLVPAPRRGPVAP
jgi:uncharacterized repeat protein (TIGR01451 family)